MGSWAQRFELVTKQSIPQATADRLKGSFEAEVDLIRKRFQKDHGHTEQAGPQRHASGAPHSMSTIEFECCEPYFQP